MKVTRLTPELVVEDMARSVEFYTEVVGLKLIEGNNNWGRLGGDEDGVEMILMLKKDFDQEVPNLKRAKNEGWGLLVVEVAEIENLYNKIAARVMVKKELVKTPYGTREFTIEDPDGYLVQFTQKYE